MQPHRVCEVNGRYLIADKVYEPKLGKQSFSYFDRFFLGDIRLRRFLCYVIRNSGIRLAVTIVHIAVVLHIPDGRIPRTGKILHPEMRLSPVDFRPAAHIFHRAVRSKRGRSGSEFSLVRGGTGKLGIVCNNIRQLFISCISRKRNVSAFHSPILFQLRKRFLLCHNDFLIEGLPLHKNTEKNIQVLLREISSDNAACRYRADVRQYDLRVGSDVYKAVHAPPLPGEAFRDIQRSQQCGIIPTLLRRLKHLLLILLHLRLELLRIPAAGEERHCH